MALLYRLVLRCCPHDFRERFGPEILATASEVARDRSSRPLRALRDAFALAAAIRVDLRRERTIGRGSRTGLLRDLRFATRGLGRDPRFSLFVIAILGVAIAATTTVFGLADRLVLRGPDRITDAGRIRRVELTATPPGRAPLTTASMGHVLFAAIRDHAGSVTATAAYAINDGHLGRGAAARPIRIGYASEDFFAMLGPVPTAGRLLAPGDSRIDPALAPIAIGDGLWRREFAEAPDVIGRQLVVDDVPRVIVGVAPKGFSGAEIGPVDVWLPMAVLSPRVTPQWQTAWSAQWLSTIVRLKDGVEDDAAENDLTGVLRSRYDGPSAVMRQATIALVPLTVPRDRALATDARVLTWLGGVAILILVVACANVMSLMLARTWARRREIAVRVALGASRGSIVRLGFFEAGSLASAGAIVGVAVAIGLERVLQQTLFQSVEWTEAWWSLRRMAAVGLAAAVVAILTGLSPALHTSAARVPVALRMSSRSGGATRSRARAWLTTAQAAASVMLLVGAGLFIRSFWNARTLNLGVDADHVTVVELARSPLAAFAAGPMRDAERARRRLVLQEAVSQVRAVPGVDHAAVAVGMPFGFRFGKQMSAPSGIVREPVSRSISAVSPGYFTTVGTPLLEGRGFDERDGAERAPVAIVSASMAREFWPAANAIGQCLTIEQIGDCVQVVGIAADTHRERLDESPVPHVYVPWGQESGFGGDVLLVRTATPDTGVGNAVTGTLVGLDGSITAVQVDPLRARLDPQMRSWRFGAIVFAFAGVAALLVSAAGFYGVLSYAVAATRHETGVRLALGASASHVGGRILRVSAGMCVIGIAAGMVAAFALAPQLEPFLFRVSARDPVVFTVVAGVLVVMAVIAGASPAITAARIDPIEVLRAD